MGAPFPAIVGEAFSRAAFTTASPLIVPGFAGFPPARLVAGPLSIMGEEHFNLCEIMRLPQVPQASSRPMTTRFGRGTFQSAEQHEGEVTHDITYTVLSPQEHSMLHMSFSRLDLLENLSLADDDARAQFLHLYPSLTFSARGVTVKQGGEVKLKLNQQGRFLPSEMGSSIAVLAGAEMLQAVGSEPAAAGHVHWQQILQSVKSGHLTSSTLFALASFAATTLRAHQFAMGSEGIGTVVLKKAKDGGLRPPDGINLAQLPVNEVWIATTEATHRLGWDLLIDHLLGDAGAGPAFMIGGPNKTTEEYSSLPLADLEERIEIQHVNKVTKRGRMETVPSLFEDLFAGLKRRYPQSFPLHR